MAQHELCRRLVETEQNAGDRVLVLGVHFADGDGIRDPAQPPGLEVVVLESCEEQSDGRIEGDCKDGGDRHREVLREGKGSEEAPLLSFEGEDRHERDGDDQQREEARPAHLLNGADEDLLVVALPAGRLPDLELLVCVLDDDDRRVHERADRDCYAAERHDVRADAEHLHGDEREDDGRWDRDDRDDGARDVPEEDQDHEGDDQHLEDELVLQRLDRPFDQLRPVVGRDDLDPVRERGRDGLQAFLDSLDDVHRVLAVAHHDDSGRDLTLAVELRDAPPDLGTELDLRHVPEADGCSLLVGLDDDLLEIRDRPDVAAGPDHVLGAAPLDETPADLTVGGTNRFDDRHERHSVRREPVGIDRDLILAHEAAKARHFRHARNGLEVVANVPVLDRPQIRERVLAALVHEGVLEDPAHPGRIRTELRPGPLGQARLDFREVLERAATRPVEVRTFFEDDVDVREAEVGEPADCLDLRRPEHRGDDGIGDLVLDDVGTAVPA